MIKNFQLYHLDPCFLLTKALARSLVICRPMTNDVKALLVTGADPGFLLGGGAPLRNDVTDR